MKAHTGLTGAEIGLLTAVLRKYPQIQQAVLFGSRAKGAARANSDIDLALYGDISAFTAESVALDMDELPLPYLFDVKAVAALNNPALIDHIERVGLKIYP
jgi:predicted nucleotidyltransferase